jgi:hypothetical protein
VSGTAFSGWYTSTVGEYEVSSSEPAFASRASVRRYRRAQEGSPMLRSIRMTRATPSDFHFAKTPCRSDWTPLELFVVGVRRWEAGLRQSIDTLADGK